MMKFMAVALALFVMTVLSGCEHAKPPLKIGDPLPALTLPSIDGFQMELPAAIKGKVTVILFWEEGCRYCERGMPDIVSVYDKLKDKGFQFVAIQIGGSPGASEEFKKRFGITFPMLHDPKSAIIDLYGIAGVPTMFLVDKAGIVQEKILGGLDGPGIEELVKPRL